MSVEAILLDFGGVIWTPLDDNLVFANRERLARQLGFEDSRVMWRRFYGGNEWLLTKTGHWTEAQMWSSLLTPLGLQTEISRNTFLEELFHGVGLKPEMDDLMRELNESYSLGVLSNAGDTLESIISDRLGIAGYFTVIVNSHRIGIAKPELEAYRTALEGLEVDPDEVYFVDDQQRNTLAAETLGIQSHVFTGVEDLHQELGRMKLLEM